jgi:hypothetical protein
MSEPLTPEEEYALRVLDATTTGEHGNVVRRLLATLDAARLSHDRGADAALRGAVGEWFASRCPVDWTEDEHLSSPTVNTASDTEQRLALAYVAALSVPASTLTSTDQINAERRGEPIPYAVPAPTLPALATDGLAPLISTVLRKYGGTMKGRGDHDIFDALVRYRAALRAQGVAPTEEA